MTFLFDIGRVLLDFEFEPSLARLLPANLVAAESRERLKVLLERKDDFEAGRIGVDDFTAWALQRLGSDAAAETFHHAWRNIFTPNEPMWAVVDRLLAAGHRLILFSNINGIHWPWIREQWPRFERFHGEVLSFEVGAIKPEPAIYRHALEAFGLAAEEVRYIDDMAANVASGRAVGFRTWQYDLRDHAAFENWLAAELARG
jgi:HAD superfamily hydrolase (TIGR01509 family)